MTEPVNIAQEILTILTEVQQRVTRLESDVALLREALAERANSDEIAGMAADKLGRVLAYHFSMYRGIEDHLKEPKS